LISHKVLKAISDEVYWKYFVLDTEIDQWYSYATHPPALTTRKEQRYYQRHFCAAYSRFKSYEAHILSTYPEYFL
jgi:hypothetical protein